MTTAAPVTKVSIAPSVPGWTFDDPSHTFRVEQSVVPSLTQILEGVGISDYSSVPEKRLEYKRDIGDAVHYAARYLDEDRLDYDTIQPVWAKYLLGWENFKEQTGFIAEGIEVPGVYSYSGMRFGCIWDRLGRFPGIRHRALVEIKCAYAEEPSWRVQLAGQEMTIPKDGAEYIARLACQLKPDGTFKLWPDINGYQDPNDRKVFLWALALTNWKISHKLEWRKS